MQPVALLRERADAVALTEELLKRHGLEVSRELHAALCRNSEVVRQQIIAAYGYVTTDPVKFADAHHMAA